MFIPQVEFSNVVVVNKGDLVNEEQKADIMGKISLLNPKAKIVESIQSRVKVTDILNTRMFNAEDNKNEFWMAATKAAAEEKIEKEVLECCETTMAKEGKKCCKSKSKDGKLVDSGLSQVGFLNIVEERERNWEKKGERKIERGGEGRGGIKDFRLGPAGRGCLEQQRGAQDDSARSSLWDHLVHLQVEEALPPWPSWRRPP